MRIDAAGVQLEVEDSGGDGDAVLLVHGWPDTHELWRPQIDALTAAGYRTIAPDLRGFGGSDKPAAVEQYALPHLFTDMMAVLDQCGVDRAHVVGHDWGAVIAWVVATLGADRVRSVTALSVGHPASFSRAGVEQRAKSWYMLLFQYAGVAEEWLGRDGWRNFRALTGHPDADDVATRLAKSRDLEATLNLYRANVPPASLFGPPIDLPPITVPALGIWSTDDWALDEAQMTGSSAWVAAPWRYERVEGAGHWMTQEVPDRVNEILLDFLGT